MKQILKITILLTLLVLFLLTACDLNRSDGNTGDISVPAPGVPTPVVGEAPPTAAPPTADSSTVPPTPDPATDVPIEQEAVPAVVAPPADMVEPGKVLVKLTVPAAIQSFDATPGTGTGIGSLDQILKNAGIDAFAPVIGEVAQDTGQDARSLAEQSGQVSQLYVGTFSIDQDPVMVAAALEQDPNVEYAEPNYIAGMVGNPQYTPAAFNPNDQYFPFQWHMQTIQMPQAWDTAKGDGIIVAVIDTGIDFGAPDLATNQRLQGFDFVNNDNDPTDDQGHGTHVAGTVAQNTNNGIGVTGVAFNARLLPVKVLAADGNGSYENIIKGIAYAVNQGAKVINMSLAGRQGSQALQDAVKMAYENGVVVVAAAGNSNGPVEYPAAYDEYVIAVGATRFDNTRTRYSNFGPQIDIVAPGGDVDVDQNEDSFADGILQQTFKSPGVYTYLFFEGTSMASPHVAGLATLLASVNPNASPADIESAMTSTARNLGSPDEYGAGLIQASNALLSFAPGPNPTDTPAPLPATDTPIPPSATDTPTPVPVPDTPTPTLPPDVDTPSPTPETPTNTPEPPTPTATPEVSPTPTAPPPPAGELLTNSGFEFDDGWIFGDTPVHGDYATEVVFNDQRSGRIGILPGEPDRYSFTSVWQEVTIPAEATSATLTAHIYPISEDNPGTDLQNILILNSSFKIIRTLSQTLSNSQTWEEHSYDLSDLSGQTIYVYFGIVNRGGTGKPTAMYVDNVSLGWAP